MRVQGLNPFITTRNSLATRWSQRKVTSKAFAKSSRNPAVLRSDRFFLTSHCFLRSKHRPECNRLFALSVSVVDCVLCVRYSSSMDRYCIYDADRKAYTTYRTRYKAHVDADLMANLRGECVAVEGIKSGKRVYRAEPSWRSSKFHEKR